MAKIALSDIVSGFASAATLNANNTAIEAALENTLSRDGTGPNYMTSDLDLNGNRILNQGNPITVEGFNWEGPWTTATLYSIGDVVENNNSSYIAITEHTSSDFGIDLAAFRWQVVASSAALPSQSGKAYGLLVSDGGSAFWLPSNAFAHSLLDDTGPEDVLNTLAIPEFAQSLLDDTTANEARATLGLSYGPVFSASSNVDQLVVTGVGTKVTLQDEEYDSDSCFASSRFTPTKAGYYHLIGLVRGSSDTLTGVAASIARNGSIYKAGTVDVFPSSANSRQVVVSCVAYLNGSTDYAELYGQVTGGVSPRFSYYNFANTSRFSGFYLRP